MLDKIEIFNMAQAMAQHAGYRQNVVARNIANADTPGYRARDVAPFSEVYENRNETGLRVTRAAHKFADESGFNLTSRVNPHPGTESPNGNTVSLEREMLNAVDVKRQHDQALTIYKSSLNILRTSLGR